LIGHKDFEKKKTEIFKH